MAAKENRLELDSARKMIFSLYQDLAEPASFLWIVC